MVLLCLVSSEQWDWCPGKAILCAWSVPSRGTGAKGGAVPMMSFVTLPGLPDVKELQAFHTGIELDNQKRTSNSLAESLNCPGDTFTHHGL